ncbi:MAG: ABC-2 family transporter protein [Candidatus Daviesbacteria bacterium]|nr:ABC-2 family transporter protein [Candidatus Daviesbacteria bacterium]
MRRYFKIFIALISISSKRYLENRANVFMRVSGGIFSLIVSIYFIEIIFSFTSNIGGWTKYEVLLLTGLFRIITSVFMFLCQRGIYDIPELIKGGYLDLILVSPVNSQFYLSFRRSKPYEILSAPAGIFLIIYSLSKLNLTFSILDFLLLFIGLLMGIIILYSIYFMLATIAIWLIQVSALSNLYHIIVQPLSIPTDILGKGVSFVLTFIIPLGVVLTVPLQVFLHKISASSVFISVIFAVLFLYLSTRFWKFALRHYTSASS